MREIIAMIKHQNEGNYCNKKRWNEGNYCNEKI